MTWVHQFSILFFQFSHLFDDGVHQELTNNKLIIKGSVFRLDVLPLEHDKVINREDDVEMP